MGSISFLNGLGCQMSYESLDGLSGNWDPFKGSRRLPCVNLSGSGRDNFIGIRALVFQMILESFSKSSGYRLYFYLSSLFLEQFCL